MNNQDMHYMFEEMMQAYSALKAELRRREPMQYERWKAGGFRIDDNVVSGYPSLGEILANYFECGEDNEEDSE